MKKIQKTVNKPWGKFYDLAAEKGKWHLKLLEVKKGHRISLQKHKKRKEFWIVAEGKIKVQKGKKLSTLSAGEYIIISCSKTEIPRAAHRR